MNKKLEAEVDFQRGETIACTLLLPRNKIRKFRARIRDFEQNTRKYFQYLLGRYSDVSRLSRLRRGKRLTAKYQDSGQELKKIHLRVKSSEWNQIGLIARTCGYSICHLFVLLFELESAKKIRSRETSVRNSIPRSVEFVERRFDNFNKSIRTLIINSGSSPP